MRAVSKYYALPVIFFIISVILIYYFKPESRERIESIANITNFNCQIFSEEYYVLELNNRTPNYLNSSTFSRTIGINSTTFVGKVNITNLENMPLWFAINYTFHITPATGSAVDDKFYANISVPGKRYEIIPFHTTSSRGAEGQGYHYLKVNDISILENVTKTNNTEKCF